MANFHQLKTIELETTKDPYKNLWRNVLIVGIEDLLRKKKFKLKLKRKNYCVEELW